MNKLLIDLPSVGDHENITPKVDKEHFRKWYTVTDVAAIAMEHQDGRTFGRVLEYINHKQTS